MKPFKLLVASLVALGLAGSTGQTLAQPSPAQAATKVRVIWTKSMTEKKLKVKKSAKGYVYTKQLKRRVIKLSNYRKATFYAKKQAKLKVNGKNRLYYYVSNSANRKTGWVWSGYVAKKAAHTTKPRQSRPSDPGIISRRAVQKLIDEGTDLQPSLALMSQPAPFYKTYSSVLNTNFNLTGQMTRFNDHQAKIYVAKDELDDYVQMAMEAWNVALGRTVFVAGTAKSHQVKVSTKSSDKWDGLNKGNVIYVNSTGFDDPDYVNHVADTPEIRDLYQQYQQATANYRAAEDSATKETYRQQANSLVDQVQAAQKAAAPSKQQYWLHVMVHELGHSLGLDHTPYLTDVMYASGSSDDFSDDVNGKYQWSSPKDPQDTRNETGRLSDRDILRAKLAYKIGYW